VTKESSALANHPFVVVLGALASIATIIGLAIALWPKTPPVPPQPDPEPTQPVPPPTQPGPHPTKTVPVPIPRSFLESVAGEYRLVSWVETPAPVTLGIKVTSGELTLGDTGVASWKLKLRDVGPATTPEPAIQCGGQVAIESRKLEGVPGGDKNKSIDWTGYMVSNSLQVWLTFCGWNVQGQDPFRLSLSGQTLQMKNKKGTFTFKKR